MLSVVLERNDAYWGDKAKTEKLIFRWSTEAAQRLVELHVRLPPHPPAHRRRQLLAQEILVGRSDYPTPEITDCSHRKLLPITRPSRSIRAVIAALAGARKRSRTSCG